VTYSIHLIFDGHELMPTTQPFIGTKATGAQRVALEESVCVSATPKLRRTKSSQHITKWRQKDGEAPPLRVIVINKSEKEEEAVIISTIDLSEFMPGQRDEWI
jgi:hypothetical protein